MLEDFRRVAKLADEAFQYQNVSAGDPADSAAIRRVYQWIGNAGVWIVEAYDQWDCKVEYHDGRVFVGASLTFDGVKDIVGSDASETMIWREQTLSRWVACEESLLEAEHWQYVANWQPLD